MTKHFGVFSVHSFNYYCYTCKTRMLSFIR